MKYENWTHQGRKHDFDCLKMFYALVEFCKLNYPKEAWYKGAAEWINKKPRQRVVMKRPVDGEGFVNSWKK